MIFELCRSARVPVWHIDMLKTPIGIVDISLIRDDANEIDPNRGPRAEVQQLGERLATTVEQAQWADQDTSEPIGNTPG